MTTRPLQARPRAIALVLAAGSGERLGRGLPKAFLPLAGRPMLEFSLLAMAGCGEIESAVLVVPGGLISEGERMAGRLAGGAHVSAVVAGGPTRQHSVRLGLAALPADVDVVICHDAARPMASAELFTRVVEAVDGGRAAEGAVPVVPSPDTVKRVLAGAVVGTVPREEVGLAQTPQAFLASVLAEVHGGSLEGGTAATDDAMLLEQAGYRVVAVPGEATNFKITTDEELRRAERALLESAGNRGLRP